MPLICNAFAENTFGETQNLAACKAPHIANAGHYELTQEQLIIAVLDLFRRASQLPMTNVPNLATGNPCDFVEALRNASCAFNSALTPQFPTTIAELQAELIWTVNETFCNLID